MRLAAATRRRRDDRLGQPAGPSLSARTIARGLTVERDSGSARIALVNAAIETADVVLQNDRPSSIVEAIRIGKATKRVVTQNIILAFGVKAIVLVLGAGGLATLWEAVFADVGVALLAILNASRMR
mgnify:CR=1 FL=1